MAINPEEITTVRVDQLANVGLTLESLFPHTVGTELTSSSIQDLATLVATTIETLNGFGFLPVSVTDGQTLPAIPTNPSFILVGAGTYTNLNGFPDIICTENLNALMTLTDHWEIAVEIPINPLTGSVQSVTGSAVDNTDPLNPVVNLDSAVTSVNGLTGAVVLDGTNIDVTDPTTSTDATLNDALQNIFDNSGGATPSLPQVLAQGDRPIRYSDGDGDTILELADREKFLYNRDADFLHLPAELFPDGTELKIYNAGEIDLFGITGSEYGTLIEINGIDVIDEFTGITLRAGTAILKKISGEPYSYEIWTLTYEVYDFSKEALGLNLVDNTPDASKPVSTAQATAIANAQSTAQTYAKNYTDNIRLKQPARLAVDTNVTSLSGQQTFYGITVSTGDVILLMAQTNSKENGLWLVNGLGAWTRPEDFRNGLDVSFVIIPVLGFPYAGRFFTTGADKIVGDPTGNGNITIQEIKYLLNGISFADGTDITAANNLLEALGKLQKQLTDVRAAKQDKEIWLSNTSPYTLTSQTALQKAFNIGTNGALDAKVRTYKFEGLISLSSLSSSPGTISFGFLGTATVASIRYTHMSMKGTLVSTPFSSLVTTVNQTVLSNANSNTAGYIQISGIVRISGAGTFIPAVGMSVAAAAVVDANSYFAFTELGTDTATNSTTGIS